MEHVYKDKKKVKDKKPMHLYGGLIFNSVLLLCIVFSIYTILICMNCIRLIFAISNYINKLKGN